MFGRKPADLPSWAELVEFLRARLDEREQTVRAAGECRIAWLTYRDGEGEMLNTTVAAADDSDDVWVAAGKELPDPSSVRVVYETARVLREVQAAREDINDYLRARALRNKERTEALGAVLVRRAKVYADHPEYPERWRQEECVD